MARAPDNPTPPSPEAVRTVNQACDRFDSAWRQAIKDGPRPRIEDFLTGVPAAVLPTLLNELVTLDMYYRRRNGETPLPHEYQGRFPHWPARRGRRDLLHCPRPEDADGAGALQAAAAARCRRHGRGP